MTMSDPNTSPLTPGEQGAALRLAALRLYDQLLVSALAGAAGRSDLTPCEAAQRAREVAVFALSERYPEVSGSVRLLALKPPPDAERHRLDAIQRAVDDERQNIRAALADVEERLRGLERFVEDRRREILAKEALADVQRGIDQNAWVEGAAEDEREDQ